VIGANGWSGQYLNPSNGKYLVYKRQASHPMHLTIHTGKLHMYVTEGVNCMLVSIYRHIFYLDLISDEALVACNLVFEKCQC
jgi:hypothetical protein